MKLVLQNKISYFFLWSFLSFSACLVFSTCSAVSSNDESPIDIKSINITSAANRMPKENSFQVDLELSGIVSSENLKQDLQYKWTIEYIKLDIVSKVDDISTDTTISSNTKTNYYFLDVSKNPLNAILSVYREGYYKIKIQASNLTETKNYAVIVKVGNPKLPTLYVKFNIPTINKISKNDFKGQFFLGYNEADKTNIDNILTIKASDVLDDWYDTKLEINSFNSFNLEAGTHIINGLTKYINSPNNNLISKNNDSIKYDFQNEKQKKLTTSPIILKDIKPNSVFSIYKDGKDNWSQGELFISYLTWSNENGIDQFSFFENKLDSENKIATDNLNNKYLVKIYIGSYGHKFSSKNFFIYFTPEGTNSDEFDPQKKREFPSLPYGYLVGKLGIDGTPFPIGYSYKYTYYDTTNIYVQNEQNNFVITK